MALFQNFHRSAAQSENEIDQLAEFVASQDEPIPPNISAMLHASQKRKESVTAPTLRDRVKQLLIAGLPPSNVASALSCSPGYVSQLLKEDAFALEVAEARLEYTAKKYQQYTDIEDNIDSIQDTLLKRLASVIPHMRKPSEILQTLAVVNRLQKPKSALPAASPAGNGEKVIALSLPSHLTKQINVQINYASDNQITEINGRSLVSAPASQVLSLLPLAPASPSGNEELPAELSNLIKDL